MKGWRSQRGRGLELRVPQPHPTPEMPTGVLPAVTPSLRPPLTHPARVLPGRRGPSAHSPNPHPLTSARESGRTGFPKQLCFQKVPPLPLPPLNQSLSLPPRCSCCRGEGAGTHVCAPRRGTASLLWMPGPTEPPGEGALPWRPPPLSPFSARWVSMRSRFRSARLQEGLSPGLRSQPPPTFKCGSLGEGGREAGEWGVG